MIFSYDDLNTALRVIGHFYNKILLVDFKTDKYRIIKINDHEYNTLKRLGNPDIFDWIEGFKNSKYSMNLNYNFDPDSLSQITKPLVLNYKKIVNNEMKDVTMELVPLGLGRAYIFVKDYSADLPKVCTDDCESCSQKCSD